MARGSSRGDGGAAPLLHQDCRMRFWPTRDGGSASVSAGFASALGAAGLAKTSWPGISTWRG
jgi:hypothetical protein